MRSQEWYDGWNASLETAASMVHQTGRPPEEQMPAWHMLLSMRVVDAGNENETDARGAK